MKNNKNPQKLNKFWKATIVFVVDIITIYLISQEIDTYSMK